MGANAEAVGYVRDLTNEELLDFALSVWGRRPGELDVREYNRRVRAWHEQRQPEADAAAAPVLVEEAPPAREPVAIPADLDESAPMPFGRYAGRAIRDVPRRYFRRLVGSVSTWDEFPEIARYAELVGPD